jgi:hypothetical protein
VTDSEPLATSRPRAGRRFEPVQELELLRTAREVATWLPGAQSGALVISEMTGPIGIPDLTVLVGADSKLDERLAIDIPPLLNQIDAGVVAMLSPSRTASLEEVADRLGWPIATLSRRLPGLLKNGAVARTSTGRLVRHPAMQVLGRTYAIEAKVRERRRALVQARSYASWADSYVLVMGSLRQDVTEDLSVQVLGDGGGLVVDGKRLVRPRIHRLPLGRRLWATEHVVAALVGYQPSPVP